MFSSIDELFVEEDETKNVQIYANMDVLIPKKSIDFRPYLKK